MQRVHTPPTQASPLYAPPALSPEMMALREEVRSIFFESQSYRLTDPERAYRTARKGLRMARMYGLPRLMIMCLIEICWHHMNRGDYDGALATMDQARAVQQNIPDDAEMKARVDECYGRIYLYQGEVLRSVELLQAAVEAASAYNPLAGAQALSTLAAAYRRLGDYPKAIEILTSVHQLWEGEEDKLYLMLSFDMIGSIHAELEEWEKALAAFFRCLELADEMGTRMERASALGQIGLTLSGAGREEEALAYLGEALELEREFGRRNNEAGLLGAIAAIHGRRDMAARAIEMAREALAIQEEIGEMRGMADTLALLGELHVAGAANDEALPPLGRAIAIARENGHPEIECRAHAAIARALEALGDAPGALDHYKNYMRLEKELHGIEVRRKVVNVQMRADLEKMERERELLRVKAEGLERDVEHKERELATAALSLAQKSQILARLQEQIAPFLRSRGTDASELARALLPQIRESADAKAQWQAFDEQFRQVHPDLIPTLLSRYPGLTPTELKVCALMKINLTTKEIADILRTSTRTVEGHRRFIRKKMNIPPNDNLSTFLALLK